MVAVSADHIPGVAIVALCHPGRIRQTPASKRAFPNHQTYFVAEIELVRVGYSGDKPDGVKASRFSINQITPDKIGNHGGLLSDGHVIAGVGTLQKDPFSIEMKVAVDQAQFAESTANGVLMGTSGFGCDRDGNTVQEWVVKV